MKKNIARIMALALAALMAAGIVAQLIASVAYAAEDDSGNGDVSAANTTRPYIAIESVTARRANGNALTRITTGTPAFTLEIVYTHERLPAGAKTMGAYLTNPGDLIPTESRNATPVKLKAASASGSPRFQIQFEDIKYGGTTGSSATFGFRVEYSVEAGGNVVVSYDEASDRIYGIENDEKETADPNEDPLSSRVIVETVRARDSGGNIIETVTKDTPPFTLEIIFTEWGLNRYYTDELHGDDLFVSLTEPGELTPASYRGTLREATTPGGDPQRYTATFQNMRYEEEDGDAFSFTDISFQPHYIIRDYGNYDEYPVSGEPVKARLYGIEQTEEDEGDIDPATPYIIIDSYSLGAEQIEAGNTFTLSLNFKNTSSDLPLENIRLVVNPVSGEGTTEQSFLSIASETNTYYYERLGAAAGGGQTVDIRVKGEATVGSQALSLDFTYEYIIETKSEDGRTTTKKRVTNGQTSTVIYVPITQIDRFSVDPVTDYEQYPTVGDEGYVIVSFVNQGRSTTYNVSGYLMDAQGDQGQTAHHGNLEAGASGSLEFSFFPEEAGEYVGTIVIRYEDGNGEEKEIPVTFTAYAEEGRRGGVFDPGMVPGMEEETPPEAPATPWWRYALFIGGALAIAAPLAFYIAKRILAKSKEEMDDDF